MNEQLKFRPSVDGLAARLPGGDVIIRRDPAKFAVDTTAIRFVRYDAHGETVAEGPTLADVTGLQR